MTSHRARAGMRLEHLPGPAGRTADGFGAVVFDMDGVVTDTAATHAAAWKTLFDEALPRLAATAPPFDIDADYRPYVDGRAREDGVRAFCAARGLALPEGDPDDDPGALTVHGLAKRKQRLFAAELARTGVRVFPDAAALLESLRAAHVPTALVTASRNAAAVLDAAGLSTLFTVRVDGTDAEAEGLPGKPDPALFLEAARRLGVEPPTPWCSKTPRPGCAPPRPAASAWWRASTARGRARAWPRREPTSWSPISPTSPWRHTTPAGPGHGGAAARRVTCPAGGI